MKANIFEGARRISLALGGLWALGCFVFAVFSEPSVDLTYSIAQPGLAPVPVSKCGDFDAMRYTHGQTTAGATVSVTLCLKARRSDSGELLVPYAPVTDGQWLMASPYSAEVLKYAEEVVEGFQLPADAAKEADRLRIEANSRQWKDAMQALFGGLIGGWALVASVGWIARGFMNIPRGKDGKTIEATSSRRRQHRNRRIL